MSQGMEATSGYPKHKEIDSPGEHHPIDLFDIHMTNGTVK